MSRRGAGRLGRALILSALLLIVAGAVGVPNAQAAPAPGGNNGTVKIDGQDIKAIHANDPHVGCEFNVEWFGFDEGTRNATVTFEGQQPTGGGTLVSSTGDQTPTFQGSGSGNALDHSEKYDLTSALSGITPHPQQGWHVKVTINTDESHGSDKKSKVFWVSGCGEQQPENGSISLTKTVAGDNKPGDDTSFDYTVDCDDNTGDGSGSITPNDGQTVIVASVAVGSVCTITETGDQGATSKDWVVDGGSTTHGDSVEVTVSSTTEVEVALTNNFDPTQCEGDCGGCEGVCGCQANCGGPEVLSSITLDKDTTGNSVPAGDPSFAFSVDCTDPGASFNSSVSIKASDAAKTIASDLSTGTSCTIKETNSQGATGISYKVNGQDAGSSDTVIVHITSEGTVAVVATNDFTTAPPVVLPEQVTPPPDQVLGEEIVRPALARTGIETGRLIVTGLAMLITGLALLGWSKRAAAIPAGSSMLMIDAPIFQEAAQPRIPRTLRRKSLD